MLLLMSDSHGHDVRIRRNPSAEISPYKFLVTCSCNYQALSYTHVGAQRYAIDHRNRWFGEIVEDIGAKEDKSSSGKV